MEDITVDEFFAQSYDFGVNSTLSKEIGDFLVANKEAGRPLVVVTVISVYFHKDFAPLII
jgi:hypothetical protein